MEHLDEQEALIQFSEMTAFDFSSEEFQKIQRDYTECRNFIEDAAWKVNQFINKFRPAKTC